MRKTKKSFLAMLLSLAMVLTCFLAAVPAMADTTDAQTAPETVTVYFSLSNDGQYVVGNDANHTVLCRVPMTVSYFDLADYGLENFYRTDDSGNVIESPTLLHVYIRTIEQYCLGGGTLVPGVSTVAGSDYKALNITGSATSMYMQQFWGHDENLMYFVNHQYPLMYEGWGATADWILMDSGDEIDVAMFSDWSFWTNGAFANFTDTDIVVDASTRSLTTTLQAVSTGMGGPSSVSPEGNTPVYLVPEDAVRNSEIAGTGNPSVTYDAAADSVITAGTNGSGVLTTNLPSSLAAGVYYLIAGPDFNGTIKSGSYNNNLYCVAPAVAKVTIPSSTVSVTGVSVTPATLSLSQGDTSALTAAIAPANATNQNVSWSSSNTNAAMVNASGLVTAVAPGSATITVTTADGGFTASCAVTVSNTVAVTGITLNQAEKAMNPGGTGKLTAAVLPANATNQNVAWSTSDSSVVAVAADASDAKTANLTAGTAGTATVTATTEDGSKAASCTVTVSGAVPSIVNDVYQLGTEAELVWFAGQVNDGNTAIHAALTNNIALTDAWTPIGDTVNQYSGAFDGCGKSITGLNVTDTGNTAGTSAYLGLFGYVNGATIKNLTVAGTISNTVVSTTESYAGGIAAYAGGGVTIENCHSQVEISTSQFAHCGGIVGKISAPSLNPTTITRCSNTGLISGAILSSDANIKRYLGGIVGVGYNVAITESYNTADILAADSSSGNELAGSAGGIAGDLSGDSGADTAVDSCYNSGMVQAYTRCAGLIASQGANVTLKNSYNAGLVRRYTNGTAMRACGSAVYECEGIVENTYGITGGANYLVYDSSKASIDSLSGLKSAADMQTEAFVTQLNDGGSAFTYVSGGYPVLSWQQ